jgi:hypothetical protein
LSLVSAKPQLEIAGHALARAILQVLEGNLLRFPSVREDGVLWNLLVKEARETKLTVGIITE